MRTRCMRKGINWDLNLDEGIDLCIYVLGAYEPRTLRAYTPTIRSGDVVFDVGANIGAHTMHFARMVGNDGRVYAFEPTDYASAKLRANLALNPDISGRVVFEQCLLVADGDEPKPTMLYSRWPVAHKHNDLNADHKGTMESLVGANACTADEYCERLALKRVDFVKLDVDGNELSVVNGFRRSLERFKPYILIELAPYVYKDSKAHEFDAFVNYIANLGYRFDEVGNGAEIPGVPALLRQRIKPGESMNFLLIPPGKG